MLISESAWEEMTCLFAPSLRKFPDFYDVQKIYCAEEKREKRLFLRFDEQTNKMLIKAKNRSGRSKSLEVYLRLKAHLL
ncbi:TraY domain-containing protein, partial [Klebsiella pneumoniae]